MSLDAELDQQLAGDGSGSDRGLAWGPGIRGVSVLSPVVRLCQRPIIPTTAFTRIDTMPMGIMTFQPMFINWS